MEDFVVGNNPKLLLIMFVMIFLCQLGYGQKWSYGVPPPAFSWPRLNPAKDIRKGTKKDQVLMTSSPDSTIRYYDKDTAAMILAVPVAGRTLFVDSIAGNNAIARRGFIDYPFSTLKAASDSSRSGDILHVWPGTYLVSDTLFSGKTTANIQLSVGSILDMTSSCIRPNGKSSLSISGPGTIRNIGGGWAPITTFPYEDQDCTVDIDIESYIGNNSLFQTRNKRLNANIRNVNLSSANGVIGYFSGTNEEVNIKIGNIYSTTPATNSYQWSPGLFEVGQSIGFPNTRSKYNIEIGNAIMERRKGKIFSMWNHSDGATGQYVNIKIGNFLQFNNDSINFPYESRNIDFGLINYTSDETPVMSDANVIFNCDNLVSDQHVVSHYYANVFNNCTFIYDIKKCETKKQATILMWAANTFNNCKIIIRGDYVNTSGQPLIDIGYGNFNNTTIELNGNFKSTGKVIECYEANTFTGTSAIIVNGKIETTSASLPAIDMNYSDRLFINGSIITGGGPCIDNSQNNTINCIIRPGSSANFAPSGDVTQTGGSTILINSLLTK